MVLENGYSDVGQINDYDRIEYFREHLQQILDVIHNDGCHVRAYSGLAFYILGFQLKWNDFSDYTWVFHAF